MYIYTYVCMNKWFHLFCWWLSKEKTITLGISDTLWPTGIPQSKIWNIWLILRPHVWIVVPIPYLHLRHEELKVGSPAFDSVLKAKVVLEHHCVQFRVHRLRQWCGDCVFASLFGHQKPEVVGVFSRCVLPGACNRGGIDVRCFWIPTAKWHNQVAPLTNVN